MKFLFLLAVLLISRVSFADAWDNLTKAQAEIVVEELKVNPYIFDYCDCCSATGEYATTSHLVKVKSAEIIPCSWNSDYYSLSLTVEYICEVVFSDDESGEFKIKVRATDSDHSDFSMNYTWGFNTVSNMAAPFFSIVSYDLYDEQRSCGVEFMYPHPKQVKAVSKVKGYAKWYKANIK